MTRDKIDILEGLKIITITSSFGNFLSWASFFLDVKMKNNERLEDGVGADEMTWEQADAMIDHSGYLILLELVLFFTLCMFILRE